MLRQKGLLAVCRWSQFLAVRGAANKKTIVLNDPEHGTVHLSENEADEYSGPDIEENLTPHTAARPDTGPMERSVNHVTLLGRVGSEPQMRGNDSNPVTVFSLATNSMWKTPNPGPSDPVWTTRTDWHNVAVFKPRLRDQAFNYIVKGTRVHVTGRIVYGEVVDKAGVRRHTTTIAAEDIIYLNRPNN